MAQFIIPKGCVISKSTTGVLLLLKEEKSTSYDGNPKTGYFKCLIPKNGKFYSNGLFVTRNRKEVFKTVEEAKEHKYSFL